MMISIPSSAQHSMPHPPIHTPNRAPKKITPVFVSFEQGSQSLFLQFSREFSQVEIVILENGIPIQEELLGYVEQEKVFVPFDGYDEESSFEIRIYSGDQMIYNSSL